MPTDLKNFFRICRRCNVEAASLFRESPSDHLGEGLLFGLRLPRQLGRAVAEARDVVLHVGDLVLLPLVPEAEGMKIWLGKWSRKGTETLFCATTWSPCM